MKMAQSISPMEAEAIEQLWLNGLTDRQIAEELRCNTKRICNFRAKHDMGSNVGIFDWDELGYSDNGKRNYNKNEEAEHVKNI
ncbi:hypothetical protein SBF1_50064 [Candidatus Desulfosporosinus infrequens]|uniref:Uncharacterized protein n=1 Tax=Candidatus Desulfosporosinus infrequens TaxID=2043169 RepID=A0A2U3LH64_9FIRM|nr:hypothetical protein SBF1_50064 [Candidatus Desulfosporosinus infrequens]